MPSILHQALVELFRRRRGLATELLVSSGAEVPDREPVAIDAATFTNIEPPNYDADLVLRVGPDGDRRSIIVEVQRRFDREKRKRWPLYLAHQWNRTAEPVHLLVIALTKTTAKRYRKPIVVSPGATDTPPTIVQPVVFGPGDLPLIEDGRRALASPALAVLSTLVHRRDRRLTPAAARASIEAVVRERWDDGTFWVDLLITSLPSVIRTTVESWMGLESNWVPKTPILREHFEKGKREGLEQGLQAARRTLRAIFEARGLTWRRADEGRVEACEDLERLEAWSRRAATAASAADVFDE